ncbi:hypothetical protein [Rhizobium leguminosarum]|uniref:hypothetical protein n=1 Tax=Rhizobium leguminosarum TaxID=384 RepID=UPI002E0D4A3F|nr:hypothetical protein U8Q02_39100 [Rhizobium leguminosarum]
MHDLSIDAAVAERMGYEDVAAAVALADGEIEFALLAPGSALSPNEWTVVIHYGTDPDKPELGASSVEDCGIDRDAAERYYLTRIAEHRESLRIDEEVRALNAVRP